MCLELGLVFVAASTSASHLFGSALPFFPLILATWSLVIFVLISELTEWHWQRVAARGDTGSSQERLASNSHCNSCDPWAFIKD